MLVGLVCQVFTRMIPKLILRSELIIRNFNGIYNDIYVLLLKLSNDAC